MTCASKPMSEGAPDAPDADDGDGQREVVVLLFVLLLG
jgi:hypothetical protein